LAIRLNFCKFSYKFFHFSWGGSNHVLETAQIGGVGGGVGVGGGLFLWARCV
jgi:hypothetical protein